MKQSTVDNLSNRELLRCSDIKSDLVQASLAKRLEVLLNDLDTIEGGVSNLRKELLATISKVNLLIYNGKLSKARTEANCLKVKVSKSTKTILNLIKGNIENG